MSTTSTTSKGKIVDAVQILTVRTKCRACLIRKKDYGWNSASTFNRSNSSSFRIEFSSNSQFCSSDESSAPQLSTRLHRRCSDMQKPDLAHVNWSQSSGLAISRTWKRFTNTSYYKIHTFEYSNKALWSGLNHFGMIDKFSRRPQMDQPIVVTITWRTW